MFAKASKFPNVMCYVVGARVAQKGWNWLRFGKLETDLEAEEIPGFDASVNPDLEGLALDLYSMYTWAYFHY